MKRYEKPEMEKINFDFSDIIQTSGDELTNIVNGKVATNIGSTDSDGLFE